MSRISDKARLIRLARERGRRKIRRRGVLAARRAAGLPVRKAIVLAPPGYDPVIQTFAGGRSKRPAFGKEEYFAFPETFSFIDDPEGAMESLTQVAQAIASGARKIIVDQSRSRDLDLCAVSVLNALAFHAAKEYRTRFRGKFPSSLEATEIVLATGLPKYLGLPLPTPPTFLTYPLTRGYRRTVSAREATHKERHTQALAEYINGCLERYGFTLTRRGIDLLSQLSGEVITNAEDHSGRRDWWLAAYLRQPEGQAYGDCHLTIFNFGRTLAGSLQQLPPRARLRQEIEALVALHMRKGLLVFRQWTEENLWTVYALQEGVSAYNPEIDELGTRGVGTIRMIDTFERLGKSSRPEVAPRMCLISGHTHITFDGRFHLSPKPTTAGEVRKVIAFNAANDLSLPPDRGAVRHLARRFPGTLISLRFFIDPAYLVQLRRPQ